MIAIIDYGVGNLFSLASSVKAVGEKAVVTSAPEVIRQAERIILPGVGAFGDAVEKLHQTGMAELVKEQAKTGKPILGICLGMQLLFDRSYEYGLHEGLGLVQGEVRPITSLLPEDSGLDVPHMGWNALHFPEDRVRSEIFRYLKEGDHVYFVHSYAGCSCEASLTATAEYGFPVTAAVQHKNVYGTQFHPEKSGEVGMKILKAFAAL